jgi:hypothetical protein
MNYKDSLFTSGMQSCQSAALQGPPIWLFPRNLLPYDSLIWDIETLHFTPPGHPTSIHLLGIT